MTFCCGVSHNVVVFEMFFLCYKYPHMVFLSPGSLFLTPATKISLKVFCLHGVNAEALRESVGVNGRFGK